MKKYAIDTQALVKFMHGRKVINNKVDSILRRVDEGKDIVIIPSAVIVVELNPVRANLVMSSLNLFFSNVRRPGELIR